jgi:hypothetical protein
VLALWPSGRRRPAAIGPRQREERDRAGRPSRQEAPLVQRGTVTIFGLDAMALPESYTPLESIAVIKALDETGQVSLLIRSTDGLNTWEQIGMLDTAMTVTREGLCKTFEDETEEDE